MKKTLYLMMALLMMAGAASSCGEKEAEVDYSGYSEEELQEVIAGKFDELFGEDRPWQEEETEAAEAEAEPWIWDLQYYIDKYDVFYVSPFYNGVAKFEIGYGETFSFSDDTGNYKDGQYGYVDTEGNVLVLPVYTSLPEKYAMPLIGKCMFSTHEDPEMYREKTIILSDWDKPFAANVTENTKAFGTMENGYFWIHNEEVKLSGNVSSMTYYNESGETAFVLENARPVGYEWYFSGYSDFCSGGYALVELDGIGTLIDTSGNAVPLQYVGDQYENIRGLNILERYGNKVLAMVEYTEGENETLRWTKEHFVLNMAEKTYYEVKEYGNVIHTVGENVLDWNEHILYSADRQTVLVDFNTLPAFEGGRISGYFSLTADDRLLFSLMNDAGDVFYTICDTEGNVLMEPRMDVKFIVVNDEAENVYAACDMSGRKYGTVTETGEWVVPPQYDSVTVYRDGWTVACNGSIGSSHCRYYYYDAEGNLLFTYHPGTAW